MFDTILVPVDGSELSESAVPVAAGIARDTGASIVIATVVAPGDENGPHLPDGDEARAAAEGYVKRLASTVSAAGINVGAAIERGDPAHELNEIVERERADLVVIASRGRSGLVRGLLGSVTDRLIHVCRAPVLVVRPETARKITDDHAHIKAVIVPLDGSELSEQALEFAVPLARATSASLLLIRCVRYPTLYASDHSVAGFEGSLVSMAELEQQAEAYLRRVADRLRSEGVDAAVKVAAGHPRTHISEAAADIPGALIVLTSHGASGITRWVLGSVADGLVRTAPVPTMVIPMRRRA